MQREIKLVVEVTQDNYGRWFVEVEEMGGKRAPIRCLSEREARAVAVEIRRASLQTAAA